MKHGTYEFEMDGVTGQFLKNLTGKKTIQDAYEHFAFTCMEFFILPEDGVTHLRKMGIKMNPLLVDDYLKKDQDDSSKPR